MSSDYGTVGLGAPTEPSPRNPPTASDNAAVSSEVAGLSRENYSEIVAATEALVRKKRRVRTGCLQCKRRRVRCDENGRPKAGADQNAGCCGACVRLGLPCTWPSQKQSAGQSNAKCKATKSEPRDNGADSSIDSQPEGCDTTMQNDALVRMGLGQITRDMVDAFFQEVYPCSVFGFIRKGLFYEQFDNGAVSQGLLLSMCSLSVKFVLSNHEEKSRGWTFEAKSQVHRDMERGQVTGATLSSLILCFHQELFNRVFGAAWMTSGMAIRLAFALRLNMTPTVAPPGTKPVSWAEGEARRRMMWAVYVMDMYVCDGFPEYSNVPRSSLRIQLPCDEESFASDQGYESGTIDGTDPLLGWHMLRIHPRSAASPFVQSIIIFSIRTTILRYIRKKAVYQDLPWNDNSTVTRCGNALRWWKDNLPPELEIQNQERFSTWSLAQLSTILSLHLWHCMCFCDLGRLTIFNFIECASPDILLAAPQSYVSDAQNKCVEYASKMLELCKYVLQNRSDFVSRDPYMASCLYQAIRITLWDIFRHPSPSLPIKKFLADSYRPAIIMLHRLAKLFSYAGSVMEDTFGLLRRYGMQTIMANALPDEISSVLCHSDRLFKPGPAIFLDASEQSALRISPDPTSLDQMCAAPDRGESELFRPPFHSRKDVRVELESLNTSSLTNDEDLTPPSASWNQQPRLSWQETSASMAEAQNNGSVQSANADGSMPAAYVPEDNDQTGVRADMISRILQMQNNGDGRSRLTGAISSVLPGIFGGDSIGNLQTFGDANLPSSADPLEQLWPSMYPDDVWM